MKQILSLFFLLFLSNTVSAQAPNDCVNALTVCGNGAFSSNASGIGNTQEINACGGFEHESLWLEIHVVQGGTLGFDLIPDDPDIGVDYDFWVFGPNAVCGALGSPIRCATTNPLAAGLSSNLTGMNGATLITQTGPDANGNGYVRWLNVLPGQSYYIAIDRPVGGGGFQIQWTGTATAGTGAFPAPPSAIAIPDVLTCSNTPNVGIFDLNTVRPLINPDIINNSITFHTTLADANDGVNPLPNIYANTSNPQTIYVRVTDIVAGCYSIVDFDLVVNIVPTATVSISTTSICPGDLVTVTFTGTPNAQISYNIDGGVTQTTFLNTSGTFTITESPATDRTYTLTNVRIIDGSGNVLCTQPLNQSVSVVVNPLPTVTISGATTICSGTSAVITFTGTPNATVTYSIDGGTNQTISLNGSGTATIATPLLTINSTYNLVSVASASTPICSQNQTGSVLIAVSLLPTATVSGSTTICSGSATTITFNGTPNAIVTYTVNGGTNQTINLGTTGNFILNTPALTVDTTYALVSASFSGSAACSQSQSGSALVTIGALPTATILGTTSICSGNAAVISFSGTANATVTYTINGGTNQTILLNGSGTASLPTSILTNNTTYDLVSVALSGTPPCSQSQSGSVLITVNLTPTVTISGTTTICSGDTTLITFTGTPNATVTYTINGGSNLTTVLNGMGTSVIPTPFLTAASTYALVSVATATCSQLQNGSAVVTVNLLPVITNVSANRIVCSGDLVATNAFVSSPAGANFTWTNSNSAIGLAASGTGNIPNFTASNNGTATITSSINITATLNNCPTTGSFTITVNPIPHPNPVITDYELCDYNNHGDGIEIFNLGTKNAEIINGQTGVTVTYYDSLSNAQAQTNPLPNLYSNTSNPQQIWITIRYNATGCNATSSFHLIVNPLPTIIQPQTIFECSNGIVLTTSFNLTINQAAVTGNVSGLAVEYYHSLLDAQTQNNAIATPNNYLGFDNETIFIRVENNNTGCYATTTQLLRVTQGPVAVTPLPMQYCDPNNDGFGVFNLDSKIPEISGGILPLGVSVTFHETQADAFIGANALTSPYDNINPWSQIIYVRVFYTLTGCANYVQLKLNINPTPEATQPTPYQLCDDTAPMGVENFDLTTKISEILGSINPTFTTVTFYTTLVDAQTSSNAITSTTSYQSGNQTLYVRVETIATGCYDIVTLTLVVNPLPNSAQPNYPQYSLCDNNQSSGDIGYEFFDLPSKVNSILLGQLGMDVTFYASLGDAQNDFSPITIFPYRNVSQYVQTLGIRITNHLTGCYVVSTMDIRVEPLPTPIPQLTPYTLCDENQDGFTNFNLPTLESAILQGANYILTFHETLPDANLGANPINTTLPYTNLYPFVQILYVRAEDPITHCVNVIPIELNVNPSPIAPINVSIPPKCDQDNNTQNGNTGVDLTQATVGILLQQPLAASNYTVTYYTTQALAQQGTAPIITTTNYIGNNGDTIWVRVENNNTNCYSIGSFQLEINIPLLLITPTPFSICDDDGVSDGSHVFDLTIKNTEINQGTGYTVTYYPSLIDAQNNTNIITIPTAYIIVSSSAVQTLGVVVTSPAGCKSITTLDIRVMPIPVPNNPPALTPKCDDNNPGDMLEVFDLTTYAGVIKNGDPNLTLHYFYTYTDAVANNIANEIGNPSTALVGANVWIRVENNRVDYQGNNCYVIVEQVLTVYPLPIVTTGVVHQECEQDLVLNNGIEQFDLTQDQTTLLAGNTTTPGVIYTVAFYEDAALTMLIANPTAYSNTINPQTIYVVVTNSQTGCNSQGGSYTILVNPKPVFAFDMPTPFTSCDTDGVNDGQMFYQNNTAGLADYVDDILGPTQLPADFIVEFYNNQSDAELGNSVNAIQNLTTYQVATGRYWIRLENTQTGCYQLDFFDVIIEQLAEPIITSNTGSAVACVDWGQTTLNNNLILDSGITGANYTFEWYLGTDLIPGETSSTLTITSINQVQVIYGVKAISLPPMLGCTSEEVYFTVIRSGTAANVSYTVADAFTENQIITVSHDGYGTYEYSLDDGPHQGSPIFEGVNIGEHTIYVWDATDPNYSCGVVSIIKVQTIDYPYYFTPNGDGIHDTWNIVGLDGQPAAKIFIFDRYGKLLKQISSTGLGWDGTFNGHLLPSDDYWFTVDYIENAKGKQFKAHFAMKR